MSSETTKPVDERVETVARALRKHQLDNLAPERACICGQELPASGINDDPLITRLHCHQSVAVVAALDDADARLRKSQPGDPWESRVVATREGALDVARYWFRQTMAAEVRETELRAALAASSMGGTGV